MKRLYILQVNEVSIMNAIQCKRCHDILVPIVRAKIRTCFCGAVQMRAVHPDEQLPHLVEVKLSKLDALLDNRGAQVVKIHNDYLFGKLGVHEFADDELTRASLFYANKSQIVLAPLDTPGVKVVDEWTNKEPK